MPKQTRILTLFLPIYLLAIGLFSQNIQALEKEVLHAYQQRNYSAALSLAENLLSADSQRVDALFICGESAMYLGAFELAETYLQQIPIEARKGLYAVTDLRLAEVEKKLGKCKEAKYFFERYRTENVRTADVFLLQIQEELKECSELSQQQQQHQQQLQQPLALPIEIKRLGDNVNTDKHERSPFRYADKLYFTSSPVSEKTEAGASRIYAVVRDEACRPFTGNPKEKDVHAMYTSLTTDAGRIYYSLCGNQAANGALKCNIWYRDRTYEGGWGAVKKLPLSINMPGYNTYQPSTGFDKSLNKDVLFFVSDRPGGAGKLDIWCATVERDGTFGQPFNLPFNTLYDDVTPFFDKANQSLFFSSDKPGGQGGFDVYRTEKAATGDWTPPRLMDEPLNSPFNDLFFSFHNTTNIGYFSSDRPTEKCPDPAASCRNYDIYQARMFANLEVTIFEATDSSSLSGTTIELMDLATEKIDTTCVKIRSNQSNLKLELGKSYRLIVSKENYFPLFTEINTLRINYPAQIEERLFVKSMNPKPKSTLEAGTGNKPDNGGE